MVVNDKNPLLIGWSFRGHRLAGGFMVTAVFSIGVFTHFGS
jgi:hypothetical protein